MTTDVSASPWLNVAQATEYLALPSRKALYELARRGEVPVYRLGRRLRFRREELDRLLLANRVCSPVLGDIIEG